MKVLIVEDNPMAQRIADIAVKNAGFKVDTADNGEDAYELAKSGDYSIILMDIGLPGMNGAETTCRIRQWEAGHQSSKATIFALTAHVSDSDATYYLQNGMDAVFEKPISNKLLDIMRDIKNRGTAH